jgi:hypothetical protein
MKRLFLVVALLACMGCAEFNMAPIIDSTCCIPAWSRATEYNQQTGIDTYVSYGTSWSGKPHAIAVANYDGRWYEIVPCIVQGSEASKSLRLGLSGVEFGFTQTKLYTRCEYFDIYLSGMNE